MIDHLRAEVIFNEHSFKELGGISPSKRFCLPAMHEYAKEISIDFAKWLSGEGWQQYDEPDRWIQPHESLKVISTEQLYQSYLQTLKS